jgi:uncharacterized protein YceK
MTRKWRWTTVLATAILIAVSGCATVGSRPLGTEQLLSAAGFEMKLPDTPETAATLRTLPAQTLVPQPRDGQIHYAYADPKGCGCLYVGTEKNYQEYQRLAFQRELAEKRLKAAQEYSNAVMTWGTWGPWPWF